MNDYPGEVIVRGSAAGFAQEIIAGPHRMTAEALERHRVRFVLWSVWLDVPRDKLFETNTLAPIRSYLRTHYRVVKTFTDDDFEQVWERGQ